MVGAGGAGLSAAWSAPFRRRCPTRHEGLEGVVQHGARPRAGSRRRSARRLARPARVRHRRLVARHGRPRARDMLGRRGAGRDRVARGARRERSRARATATGSPAAAEPRDGGCSRWATARATPSRRRCERRSTRRRRRRSTTTPPSSALERPNGHFGVDGSSGAEERHVDAGTVILAAGGRCYAEARERRHPDDQPARRDRRGDDDRPRAGRGGARLRRAAAPPERRRLAAPLQGYSIPRRPVPTARCCVNAKGERFVDELAPRDTVAAAIVRECEEGRGLRRRTGARPSSWTRPADRSRGRGPGDPVHAAPVPGQRSRPARPSPS